MKEDIVTVYLVEKGCTTSKHREGIISQGDTELPSLRKTISFHSVHGVMDSMKGTRLATVMDC
jgi:hypothetical protein